ncbi:bile acid:sodium symporter family protein [Paraferrimonas sp. SM1919]|uniref:bile acid:sodium symporter family protein n=1 Tax=Paraferrimonas sp. SM1919 TaxID=2662263 RepID=UPI0013D483ED|nr:bile acid:sodium symporter family protein [Paraferrimonas sp. SM1919]
MQTDVVTNLILPISLFIIMFGMGLSLTLSDFKRVASQPKAALVGIISQFIALPIVAFIIASAVNLSPELAVGLMIIAFAPGGVTSNMFVNLAKADLALSISLTAVISLLAPFTIPLLTYLAMNHFMEAGQRIELPIIKTIIQLLVITVLPVSLGMLASRQWPKVANRLEQKLKLFSVLFLFFIVLTICIQNRAELVSFFIETGIATLILNITALILGYWIAKAYRLNKAQTITIGFEVGIQNGTLAILIAGTLLSNATMVIPAATYSIFMFITGFIFLQIIKPKSQRILDTKNHA